LSIGRFDSNIGKQQSIFEFERSTKAVSRRHAIVERYPGAYTLTDLASSAGTFFNGQKLLPNVPCDLTHGDRVSFGNAGADYVWEQFSMG
jgi:pSer/pThr/pTyr-binding forkhead associated (FHA) protein